jgi:hypothetical protein
MTSDRWTDCVEQVKRVEAGIWRADEIQDGIEPLIIKIGGNSSYSDQEMNGEDHGHYMQGIVPVRSYKSKLLISNNSTTPQPQ